MKELDPLYERALKLIWQNADETNVSFVKRCVWQRGCRRMIPFPDSPF